MQPAPVRRPDVGCACQAAPALDPQDPSHPCGPRLVPAVPACRQTIADCRKAAMFRPARLDRVVGRLKSLKALAVAAVAVAVPFDCPRLIICRPLARFLCWAVARCLCWPALACCRAPHQRCQKHGRQCAPNRHRCQCPNLAEK